MTNKIYIFLFSILISLSVFSQESLDRNFHLNGYSISIGQNDSSSYLLGYKADSLVFSIISPDGFMDTIQLVNLNSDNIPDFFVEDKYCDGTDLYALVSVTPYSFVKYHITDLIEGDFCAELQNKDISEIETTYLKDINNDGYYEILLYHLIQDERRIGISCSDTVNLKEIKPIR